MFERVGRTYKQLGMAVSPDDCSLALRGLQTLAVRLEALERSTLTIATWLNAREEVQTLLHPGFVSCPRSRVLQARFPRLGEYLLHRLRGSATRPPRSTDSSTH